MYDAYDSVHLSVPQVEEALSNENKYFAAKRLGREPSLRELLIYYVQNCLPYKVAHFGVAPEVFGRGK